MRSRPEVEVRLKGSPVEPEGKLRVDAKLTSTSETPCDEVIISLEGFEKRYKRTVSSGKSSTRVYHTRTIVSLASRFPGKVLTVGEHAYRASFHLGKDLPPTFESKLSKIWYVLTVRVSIPWWPDRRARFDVVVVAPRTEPSSASPIRYETTAGPVGRDLYVEASLARPDVAHDGTIHGAFSLSNVAHNRLKRVEVTAAAVETARVQSTAGPTAILETTPFAFDRPADGQTIPFAFRLPGSWPADFTSPFIDVATTVCVRGVIGFGTDTVLNVPLRVIRAARKDDRGAVALLGSEKKVQIWVHVTDELAKLGHAVTETDPKTGILRFTANGIPIELVAEGGDKRGQRLVATVDYSNLGLDLRLTHRGFATFGGITLPGAAGERFTVEARDEAQARTFLTDEVLAALLSFEEVGASDAAAVVASAGSPHKKKSLLAFLHQVLHLSATIDRAFAKLAPPKAFLGAAGAFRAFASERSATLRVGDMSVRHLFFAGLEAGLDHRFDGEKCEATIAWLTTKVTLTPEDLAALRAELGRLVEQRGERVEVTLLPIMDPATLVPVWEACREHVRRRSGEKARGPYRT